MITHHWSRQGAYLFCTALLVAAPVAHAQEFSCSGSLGYASGSYVFSEPFRSFSLWNSLSMKSGRIFVSASVPVVIQNGSAISYVAGTALPTGGPDNGTLAQRKRGQTIPVQSGARRRGAISGNANAVPLAVQDSLAASDSISSAGAYEMHVADPIVSLSLSAYEGTGFIRSIYLDGALKPPVATVESGVGTGAWDYSGGVAVAAGLGQTLLFLNANWWVLGDMSDLELRDALYYGVALGRPVGDRWSVLASANASTRVVSATEPPVSVNVFASRRSSGGTSFNLGVGRGLTESAAGFTLSIGWSTQFARSAVRGSGR